MNVPDPQLQPPPTRRDHLRSGRNVTALALMICGIVSLGAFHFIPIHNDHGWELWPELVRSIRTGRILRETQSLLGFSSFITLTLGTIISPIMIRWLIGNPWMKWSLAVFAAMAAAIMWYFTTTETQVLFVILALTPTFTLAGLLCLKSTRPPLSDRGL